MIDAIYGETNFYEVGAGRAECGGDEFDVLSIVDDETRLGDAGATAALAWEAEEGAVEVFGFGEIGGFEFDVGDAEDLGSVGFGRGSR